MKWLAYLLYCDGRVSNAHLRVGVARCVYGLAEVIVKTEFVQRDRNAVYKRSVKIDEI